MSDAVLVVRDLVVSYRCGARTTPALRGIDLELAAGERMGLVGESGCGKSTLLRAVLRLLGPAGVLERGTVSLRGVDLATLDDEAMRRVRLERIALVPQGAMGALNPVMRVGDQIAAAVRAHVPAGDPRASAVHVAGLLAGVALEPGVARAYPHELSGGMRQRVCIALATALSPEVILADEPTTALDVVVQRRVVETLVAARARVGCAVLVVGHDVALMAQCVDRVGVMYAGRIVETSPVEAFFQRPLHPYARLLVRSVPRLDGPRPIPAPAAAFSAGPLPERGCAFAPRCDEATDECRATPPRLVEVVAGRRVACVRAREAP